MHNWWILAIMIYLLIGGIIFYECVVTSVQDIVNEQASKTGLSPAAILFAVCLLMLTAWPLMIIFAIKGNK